MSKERVARSCVCCGSASLSSSPAIVMPFVAHRALGWEPVEVDVSWGLKTIQRGMAYTVCKTLLCDECKAIFLDIRFSEAELASLYRDYRGEEYTSLRDRYEPGYRQRNQFFSSQLEYLPLVEEFLAPLLPADPTVLDWGGDNGINTPFRGRARTLHIYEISGKETLPGATAVDLVTIRKNHYDLIISSHVLEHVPYPQEHLAELRSCLAKDSVLYVEVPFEQLMVDAETPESAARAKRHWHEHVNFFSERSLRLLAEKSKLNVINLRSIEVKGGGSNTRVFQMACSLLP